MNTLKRVVPGLLLSLMTCVTAHAEDPQPRNSWRELGQLNIGRFGCKAHSVDGNRIIAIAGIGDFYGPADSSAEILDTTTGEWTLTAQMPADFVPGANPWTAKLNDGYFLVAGGFNAAETGDLKSYLYSVATDRWIRTGDLPAGATIGSNFGQTDAVVLDDGRVLAAGGLAFGVGETNAAIVFTPSYANLASGKSGGAVGKWDFTRDRARRITKLSGPTEHHKLIKLRDGRVLVIVGFDKRFLSQKWGAVYRDTPGVQAELFNPEDGTWTPLPNLPAIPGEDDRHSGVQGVRQQAAVALLNDGRVLVSGGFSQPTDDKGKPLLMEGLYERSSAVLFDPKLFDAGANPWLITGPMHVARDSHVMGTLPGLAGVISVWGWTQEYWTATAETYDVALGAWHFVAGLPAFEDTDVSIVAPLGCSAMMPDGRMLISGGLGELGASGVSRRAYYYRP